MTSKSIFRYLLVGTLALSVVFQSCKKDDDDQNPGKNYSNGLFITNEGAFQTGVGTVSFWSRDNQIRDNDIYNTINGVPLGNVAQSTTVHNNKVYTVVNNSGKMEVVNAETYVRTGTVTGLELPRYFVGLNDNKGYVSEWVGFSGNGRIAVIDLNTYQVTSTITVGALPEKMVLVGNKLYVTNSNDTTISVINTTTDAVESTISIGDWPTSITKDKNGDIWVICNGIPSYAGTPTSPSLVKFNPATPTVQTTFDFGTPDNSPSRLVINGDGDKLYYLYSGGVYELAIGAAALNSLPIISRNFYSLGIDPQTGNLYGGDALDYISPGRVIKYNTTYTAVDSFTTDIIPTDFTFVN